MGVRIATHPSLQRKGYGTEAVRQLTSWLEHRKYDSSVKGASNDSSMPTSMKDGGSTGEVSLLEEELAPKKVPPLLTSVSEIPPPYELDWIGVLLGLTDILHDFFQKCGFKILYLKQYPSEDSGDHASILIHHLTPLEGQPRAKLILSHFAADFRIRFLRMLQGPFCQISTQLVMSIADPKAVLKDADEVNDTEVESQAPLTASSLLQFLSRDDMHRLELYSKSITEYDAVLDRVPTLALLFFGKRMPNVELTAMQCRVLIGLGCQRRTVDELAADFKTPKVQVIALLNKGLTRLTEHCMSLLEHQAGEELEKEIGSSALRPLESGALMPGGEFVKSSLKKEQKMTGAKIAVKLQRANENLLSLTDEHVVDAAEEDVRAQL